MRKYILGIWDVYLYMINIYTKINIYIYLIGRSEFSWRILDEIPSMNHESDQKLS